MTPEEAVERGWQLLESGDVAGAERVGQDIAGRAHLSPEALFFLGACEQAAGHEERALAWLDKASAADGDWAEPDLRAAEIHQDAGRLDEAFRHAREAARRDPEWADAWYTMGLIAEAARDETKRRSAWLRAWEIDRRTPLESPLLSEREMVRAAEEALAELPPRARELLAGVPIIVTDLPPRQDVQRGIDPRLLGVFEGTPHPEASSLGGGPQVTQIVLFRKNLERAAGDEETLRDEIRTTLLHETGHFFGLDEDELDRLGLG